jgi:hypothetical protein
MGIHNLLVHRMSDTSISLKNMNKGRQELRGSRQFRRHSDCATGCTTGVRFLPGTGIFIRHRIQIILGPNQPHIEWVLGGGGVLSSVQWSQYLNLKTHTHLVPRLRIGGAVPPFRRTALAGASLSILVHIFI